MGIAYSEHLCLDCRKDSPKTVRPIATPDGDPPRCATHLRATKTRQRKQARARQVERTYDITAGDNHELFLLQGGRCWLCRKATGATKSLAVDHDHKTGEVRGRLCGPCNQFIGKLGDDPEAARRLVAYLTGDTPYRRLKAQQTLETANATDRTIVVRTTWEDRQGLACEWFYDGLPGHSFTNLVRSPAGVWTLEVTRE